MVLATAAGDQPVIQELSNPKMLEDMIQQARAAVENGLRDGKSRQMLQLLLPVDQRQLNFLDTEPRDYPCGIREEFNACSRVVTSILQGLQVTEGSAKILSRPFGEFENEMDPMAVLYPTNSSVASIVFPISDSLKQIKSLAKDSEKRPVLIVNPQWRSTGQVVSDFGFGPWKRQAEEFLASFEPVYVLLEQRVGEASNILSGVGGVVRILRFYPSDWQIYLMAWDGTSDLIGTTEKQPTYKELEKFVVEARKRIPWKAPPRMVGGSEPAPPPLPKSLSRLLSDEEINEMDKISLRQALIARELPTSGKIETLKERLKDAQKNSIKP
ncbi:hypothetical protein SUGI_0563590 [Cryptomeria japonica]|nr:hypothetical protein SUGI_0563590 [Cryptomeria japonica]